MLRKITPALAAATLLLAACGGGGPTISDPRQIVTEGLEATAELSTVHMEISLDGTATIPDLGGEMSLDGTSLEGDLDLENERAHFSFAVPALFGLTGEVIQIGDEGYVKTSMTGAMWAKSTASAGDPVSEAMDPTAALAEVRSFLDEEGVEVAKLDDSPCGDRECYVVRLTIPAALLSEAGEATDMDPADLVGEALVLDLYFDRQELWLTEVSTDLMAESVGTLTVRLTLSAFNESVDIQAPPADEVTEDGGEFFPF